jgi:hypothetical protein
MVPRDRSREEADRIVELRKQAWDQKNYLLQSRVMYGQPDVYTAYNEQRVSSLRVPDLVLHARDYPHISVEQGMRKAQLTGGRLVLIDGTDPWGDPEQGLRAIEAFLADLQLYTGAGSQAGEVPDLAPRPANCSQRASSKWFVWWLPARATSRPPTSSLSV